MRALCLVAWLAAGCDRTPSSCLVVDGEGLTETCMEYLGKAAKEAGLKECNAMVSNHSFRDGQACPTASRSGSCKRVEKITQRCYRKDCKLACEKSGGTFTPE